MNNTLTSETTTYPKQLTTELYFATKEVIANWHEAQNAKSPREIFITTKTMNETLVRLDRAVRDIMYAHPI